MDLVFIRLKYRASRLSNMSVDSDEWNDGRTRGTLESRVRRLFQKNPDTGFNTSGIVDGVLGDAPMDSLGTFTRNFSTYYTINNILDRFCKEGLIEAKIIQKQAGSDTYYRLRTDLRTNDRHLGEMPDHFRHGSTR